MSNSNGLNWRRREIGEMDSVIFSFEEETEFTPFAQESTTDAFVSALKSVEKFRKPLTRVLQELVEDTSVTSLPLNFSEAKSLFRFRRTDSVRLIVDLWSNSNERELRQTLSDVRNLFKQFKSGVSVDTLACVYPAPENRRAYAALRNSIVFGESRFYDVTHAPRVEYFGENSDRRLEEILGLRASLFAFLSN